MRWRGAGADTVLVSGPVEIAPPSHVKLLKVTTAREMLAACEAELPADIAVMSAAVADWRPDIAANSKIKKDTDHRAPAIRLVENPDILATPGAAQEPPASGGRLRGRDRRSAAQCHRQAGAQRRGLDRRQ